MFNRVQDHLETLREAAGQCRLVRISYLKPGAAEPTERLIEPYRLARAGSAAMVEAWQVEPEALGDTSWRNFRLDRITDARPEDRSFQPRVRIDLHAEPEAFVYGYTPTSEQTPAQAYFAELERLVMAEAIGGPEAIAAAKRAAAGLEPDRLKTVHARLYRDVLDALLLDGRIDEEDEAYLASVGRFLAELGWSPA